MSFFHIDQVLSSSFLSFWDLSSPFHRFCNQKWPGKAKSPWNHSIWLVRQNPWDWNFRAPPPPQAVDDQPNKFYRENLELQWPLGQLNLSGKSVKLRWAMSINGQCTNQTNYWGKGECNLYRKKGNPATSNLKWPPFTFVHSWASVSMVSSSVTSFCFATRRFVLATHSVTWQSRANASLIHSSHTNTLTLLTGIHSFHSRASWPLSIKQFLGTCIFRARVLVVLEKARKFQEYHNLYGDHLQNNCMRMWMAWNTKSMSTSNSTFTTPTETCSESHWSPMLFHTSVTPMSFSYQIVHLCIG